MCENLSAGIDALLKAPPDPGRRKPLASAMGSLTDILSDYLSPIQFLSALIPLLGLRIRRAEQSA
jgi:hypothetical protein